MLAYGADLPQHRPSKFLDVIALSHAIGTKDLRLLRDTCYITDASAAAALLSTRLAIG